MHTKTVVLDKRTKNNPEKEDGYFVSCMNCTRTMLVDVGADTCPICKEESLAWEDSYNPQVDEHYFDEETPYALCR